MKANWEENGVAYQTVYRILQDVQEVGIDLISLWKETERRSKMAIPIVYSNHSITDFIERQQQTGYVMERENRLFLTEKGWKQIHHTVWSEMR